MEAKQISVGDSALNVIDVGNGPTILLIHGFPLSHQMWKFQIEGLADRFRVIAPDLPGFGASPAPNQPISMQGLADELAAMLDAMNVTEPLAYCGLSMGGYVGWQFWRHHGKRLSHLIACDTKAADDTKRIRRGRTFAAQSVKQTGSGPVADTMVQKLFHQPDSKAKQGIVAETHQVIAQTTPASIAAGQLAMAQRPDASDWLSEIRIPTLFVVGEFDEITTPEEMQSNAKSVRGAEFLTISTAGHMAPLENPIQFNEGLVEFLEV